jgi:polyvinyl alcohol dehydrogenase (cytochrome)
MRISGNRPRRSGWLLRRSLLVLFGAAALAVIPQTFAAASETDWPTYGHDPSNTRNQPLEHDISTSNVAQLALKWVATTTGDVSGTPAVVDGAVYFGDFGGTVWKLDASTGTKIWSHSVSDYTGIAGDFARTSPSLDGNVLIVGTNKAPMLLGIDATTGNLSTVR